MKKVINVIRKIALAFVLLYSYNLIAVSYNLMIPINIYTVSILAFLDGPGLLLLALILKIFYWG